MRASIVIAAHNEGDSLLRTVAGVRATLEDTHAEIVVVDDASEDGSIEALLSADPDVRLDRLPQRAGVARAKDRGARRSTGDVLLFLDAHCKPEAGAIRRLIEDVELTHGDAIITPAICPLDIDTWQNQPGAVGHTYHIDLETMETRWRGLDWSRPQAIAADRVLYESPTFQGCVAAMSRRLYERLHGFDTEMLFWGSEDVDLGVRCWMLGHSVLHDPLPLVGHRFQSQFDRYRVPFPHVLANQLRMARKSFSDAVWVDWLPRFRSRQPVEQWDSTWSVFCMHQGTAEIEREYLFSQRLRDEFWYGDRFELPWPRSGPFEAVPARTATASRATVARSASTGTAAGIEHAAERGNPPRKKSQPRVPIYPTIDPDPRPSPGPAPVTSPSPSRSPAPSLRPSPSPSIPPSPRPSPSP